MSRNFIYTLYRSGPKFYLKMSSFRHIETRVERFEADKHFTYMQVFGSYGWFLPPILISLLLVNGPKAFLLALSLPIGQSTFAFAIKRYQNRGKRRPRVRRSKQKDRAKKRRSRVYSSRDAGFEESPEFTSSQGSRKRRRGYESWFSEDGSNASSNERASSDLGGWDELDSETDYNVGGSSRRASRKLSGSRGPTRQTGRGRKSRESNGPLLLRFLISVFPFLSSWTKWL